MHHPTDRITHTTALVTPVVEHWLEREIAKSVLLPNGLRYVITYQSVASYLTSQPHLTSLDLNIGIRSNGRAGRSSEVERSLMVRWVVRSILHGVDPLSYFSFQPVLHDWCNKGRGMCYPVCGMVHIKEPLLLIGKSSLCGGSGFPFSLSEWSLTICLTPYNRR